MTMSLLGWLFAIGVIVHNTEEALLLPPWSARAGRWHAPIGRGPFRFAVAVLSAAVLIAAWLATVGGPRSFGAYFIAGYGLTMALNVFIPHVAATVALRSYAPGTATGLLFNLPLGSLLVYRSLIEGYVEPSVFAIAGPVTVLCIVASIPLLFAAGRKLTLSSSG
jgi:uncharacterized membrane protein